jgi:outer membrane protein OmpA-like peptidoglycan-associated protein
MRGYYNELSKYGGIDLDANISGVEAGVDFRVLKDSPSRIYAGVLAGYIGADNFGRTNNIKSGAPLIGLYETWLNPDGWFIDAAVRYFFYSAQDVLSGQKTDFGMFSVSVEGGREFKFPANASNFFMVEPKIKGTFGHIRGATLNSIEYDAAHTLIVRPAVFAGYSAALTNGAIVEPYIEGGYNQDLSSDMKISGYGSRGISGGSFDIGGGFNAIITKILSIYTYAGYEKGDKIENLSVNAGFRIALTGIKRKENYDKKKEAEAEAAAEEKADSVFPDDSKKNSSSSLSSGGTIKIVKNTGPAGLSDSKAKGKTNVDDAVANAVSEHPVHFAFDKYTITPEEDDYLKGVAEYIKKSGESFEIDGYADRIGQPNYNRTLSERRAKAVYDRLIELGVPAEKLTYKGFGSTHQMNPDKTKEADEENRRVEINPVE